MKKLIMALGLLILVLIMGFGVALYGIRAGWFGTGTSETAKKTENKQETVVEEVEPEESLPEETVSEEHEDFIDEIVAMRDENDKNEEYTPNVVIDTEAGTLTVGSEEQENILTESDGEQVIDTEALKEAAEGTNLVIPDTDDDTITFDELAEANGMDTSEETDGTIVLSDTYQTARIIVNSTEPVTDDNAVSIAGPFNDNYVLQYDSEEAAEEACESFADDENVEYAEAEQLCFLDPPDSDGVEAYQEAAEDPESAEIAQESLTAEETEAAGTETSVDSDSDSEDTTGQSDESTAEASADDQDNTGITEESESISDTVSQDDDGSGSSEAQSGMFSYKTFETWGSDVVGLSHMKKLVKKVYGSYSDAPVVKVAVIDTGIDYNHPWFKNRLLSKGYDFVNNDKNASDDYMHGTVVSGVIAKYTSSNVKILPLKAGDQNGSLSDIDVYNAIEYAIKKKVDVINMSFGRIDTCGSDLLKEAITDARKAGILLVAAYGNDGKKTSHFIPSNYKDVIGVSAVNMYKKLASFSNYGKYVDIAAPGESIYTAYPTYLCYDPDDPYTYMDGTSLSAPFVSAACAMLKTIYPKKSAAKIRKILYNNTKHLGGSLYYGNGLLCLKKIDVKVSENTEETTAAETSAAETTSADSTKAKNAA